MLQCSAGTMMHPGIPMIIGLALATTSVFLWTYYSPTDSNLVGPDAVG